VEIGFGFPTTPSCSRTNKYFFISNWKLAIYTSVSRPHSSRVNTIQRWTCRPVDETHELLFYNSINNRTLVHWAIQSKLRASEESCAKIWQYLHTCSTVVLVLSSCRIVWMKVQIVAKLPRFSIVDCTAVTETSARDNTTHWNKYVIHWWGHRCRNAEAGLNDRMILSMMAIGADRTSLLRVKETFFRKRSKWNQTRFFGHSSVIDRFF